MGWSEQCGKILPDIRFQKELDRDRLIFFVYDRDVFGLLADSRIASSNDPWAVSTVAVCSLYEIMVLSMAYLRFQYRRTEPSNDDGLQDQTEGSIRDHIAVDQFAKKDLSLVGLQFLDCFPVCGEAYRACKSTLPWSDKYCPQGMV